jgi:hypothetical protein
MGKTIRMMWEMLQHGLQTMSNLCISSENITGEWVEKTEVYVLEERTHRVQKQAELEKLMASARKK